VAEKLGQKAPVAVQYLPKRVDDPTRRKPDITLAGEVLGWSPKVSLDDGIAQTVDWFLEKHGNPKSLM
jgi:nucleoside-diphosphate-sugar epimerase